MKKFAIIIGLATISFSSLAQTEKSATFGGRGGVNFSKLHLSTGNASFTGSSSSLTDFQAGVFGDFKLNESWSIQPGVSFYNAGGKASLNNGDDLDGKMRLSYLQIPIDVVYRTPIGGANLFIGAGPFFGYALSGKIKGTSQNENGDPIDVSEDVPFGENQFKRSNFGINTLAGIELDNGVSFNLSYDFGLTNILDAPDPKVKTGVFGLTLGYRFK